MQLLYVTHPLMHGLSVKKVQNLLHLNGFQPGPTDGQFGPRTATACTVAKRKLGYRLADCQPTAGDALVGYLAGTKKRTPAMQARAAKRAALARERASKVTMRQKALGFAKADIGIVEGSNNAVKYNAWWCGGRNDGEPYCVRAGAYWYKKAGSKTIDPRAGRYQGTDYLLEQAKHGKGGVQLVNDPKPGDWFVIDFDGRTDPDHLGVVEKMVGEWVHSIEANATLFNGQQGVGRHSRYRGNCWFIRVTA
jgi:hypothetical protein